MYEKKRGLTMGTRVLTLLAVISMLVAVWATSIATRPGDQWPAALGAGVAAGFTVRLILAAARDTARRDRERQDAR